MTMLPNIFAKKGTVLCILTMPMQPSALPSPSLATNIPPWIVNSALIYAVVWMVGTSGLHVRSLCHVQRPRVVLIVVLISIVDLSLSLSRQHHLSNTDPVLQPNHSIPSRQAHKPNHFIPSMMVHTNKLNFSTMKIVPSTTTTTSTTTSTTTTTKLIRHSTKIQTFVTSKTSIISMLRGPRILLAIHPTMLPLSLRI